MINKDKFIRGILKSELDGNRIEVFDEKNFYVLGLINYWHLEKWGVLLEGVDHSEDFTLAIEIQLNGRELTIINHVVLTTTSSERISFHHTDNDRLINNAALNLINRLDTKSRHGRAVLLDTLLYKYRGNCSIPEELKEKTKVLTLTFARKMNEPKNNDDRKVVPVKEIVGTTHPDYRGHSWQEIFYILKRDDTTIDTICLSNSLATLSENKFESERVSFIQKDHEYYTSVGSHRTTISKLIGLHSIRASVTVYQTDMWYKSAFENLCSMGFSVQTDSNNTRGFQRVTEYDWERFMVKLKRDTIPLKGENKIRFFIDTAQSLNKWKYMKLKAKRKLELFKGNAVYANGVEKDIVRNLEEIYEIVDRRNA
jgi:hypothetical protein